MIATDSRPLTERLRDAARCRRQLDRCTEVRRAWGAALNDTGLLLVRRVEFASYLELRELGVVPPEWLSADAEGNS